MPAHREVRRCKFCQCTEGRACLLVGIKLPGLEPCIYPPKAIVTVPAEAETALIPCEWALIDPAGEYVCSNPACIEKAYIEARDRAEELAAFSDPPFLTVLPTDLIEVIP